MKGSRNPQSAPICTQRTARRKFRYSQVVVFERTFFAKRTNLHGKYDHPFTAFTLDQLNLPSLQAAGVKGVLGSETADFWAADLDNAENKRFVKEFNAKYGRLPSNYAATSYDMVTQLKAAVDVLGGNTKEAAKLSAALRKKLMKLKELTDEDLKYAEGHLGGYPAPKWWIEDPYYGDVD